MFAFVVLVFYLVFQKLAGENIAEMIYFVSGGM